jgi:hypothetical protein
VSFSDRSGSLTFWHNESCPGAAIIGFLAIMFGMFIAGLGHCSPDIDGSGCEDAGLFKFLWFPGTAIFFILLGIAMVSFFTCKNAK